jgi:ABC-type nickel/cobalt efflux system permease component RcnA
MSYEEFNQFLVWNLFWNGLPTIGQAILSLCFIFLVEKWYTRAIFLYAAVSLFVVGVLMMIASYNVENYALRSTIASLFLMNRVSAMLIICFTFWVFKREKDKRYALECLVDSAISIRKVDVGSIVKNLHPLDAERMLKKLSRQH